ncbi:MAG TPA: calcium-binding protein [Methylococcaceae bacterium]|nr:calcium-binding protein [Methylococcaceae bacterium]
MIDFDRITGGQDRILVGPNVLPENITASYDDAHILIGINGTQDQLKIRWLSHPGYRIEEMVFSNGVVWDAKTIEQKAGLNVNFAPSLAVPLADKVAVDGDTFTFTLPDNAFVDPDQGDVLAYTAIMENGAPLSSWLTFDVATKTFSGVPAESDLGLTAIRVTATDSSAHSNSDVFNLMVNPAPNMALIGTAGNDTLSGKSGDDALNGMAGDDYLIGNAGNDVLRGGEGSDSLNGGAGADLLRGESGNDYLNGGQGIDAMYGGIGDDVFEVDDYADVVMESIDEGTDTVRSSLIYTLAAENVENLVLTGSQASIAEGNVLNNMLLGNSLGNSLYGWDGVDILDGASGADYMDGGLGDDVFVVDDVGDVVVENINEGLDTVQSTATFTLGANVENLVLTGSNAINGIGNMLNNVMIGNGANNMLKGRNGNDTLDGGAGVDKLIGGAGNDIYVVDSAGDVVTESAGGGTDTVQSLIGYALGANVENLVLTGNAAINGRGNNLVNTLTGNSADNILNGGRGADNLIGGTGNDTYVVDNIGDIVIELVNEGIDLVHSSMDYTLAANTENLRLTGVSAINGTGNGMDNELTGNSAINTLTGGAGNDRLDGKGGADKMLGGTGNDTYVVNVATDVITENANEGVDRVESGVTLTLGANLENLLLTGATALNGTGNALDNFLQGNSAANSLTGQAGNDTLDGLGGADTLTGGKGNDTYILGRGYGSDTVVENDATVGNTDVLSFLSDVSINQIWFQHVGSNLEVSIIGTADKMTIRNWNSGSTYHVEQFQTADSKTLLDTQVENLVSAMAAFSPPAAGQTTLPQNYQDALAPVLAANWH